MTIGKLSALFHEYLKDHNLISNKPATIDDAFPF
jgi:hypothetical protein